MYNILYLKWAYTLYTAYGHIHAYRLPSPVRTASPADGPPLITENYNYRTDYYNILLCMEIEERDERERVDTRKGEPSLRSALFLNTWTRGNLYLFVYRL